LLPRVGLATDRRVDFLFGRVSSFDPGSCLATGTVDRFDIVVFEMTVAGVFFLFDSLRRES
jgi:hypothetical protein